MIQNTVMLTSEGLQRNKDSDQIKGDCRRCCLMLSSQILDLRVAFTFSQG